MNCGYLQLDTSFPLLLQASSTGSKAFIWPWTDVRSCGEAVVLWVVMALSPEIRYVSCIYRQDVQTNRDTAKRR